MLELWFFFIFFGRLSWFWWGCGCFFRCRCLLDIWFAFVCLFDCRLCWFCGFWGCRCWFLLLRSWWRFVVSEEGFKQIIADTYRRFYWISLSLLNCRFAKNHSSRHQKRIDYVWIPLHTYHFNVVHLTSLTNFSNRKLTKWTILVKAFSKYNRIHFWWSKNGGRVDI